MNRNTLPLFLLIIITQCAFAQTWVQKASIPGAGGQSPIYFTINGKLYSGGGYNNGITKLFYEYDPQTNAWTQKADMPKENYAAGCFVVDGKGYVVCGNNGSSYFKSVYEYNPSSDTWVTKNNFPGAARMAPVGFAVNNTGYIYGGYNGGTMGEFWQYNQANDSWTQKSSPPGLPKNHPAAFVINDTAYVGLASDDNGNQFYDDMYRYNPANNSWTAIALLPVKRGALSGYSLNGKGYVACGYANGNRYSNLYEYTPQTNTWKELCPFNGGSRSHNLIIAVNGNAYIGLGSPYNYGRELWMLSPNSFQASFTFTNVACSSSIDFQNTSTGSQQFKWIFGDGKISTDLNPSHTYTANGNYTVKLVAYGSCRNDTSEKTINIGSSADPTAAFSSANTSCASNIAFQNTSQNATSYSWNFGDNSATESTQNPTHSYTTQGVYNVTLIASNACGSDTITQQINIVTTPEAVALFTADTVSCSGIVTFNNLSTNYTSQRWFFGDGDSSLAQNPSHSYLSAGSITITLIAANACNSDTVSSTINLLPFSKPIAAFTINNSFCSLSVTLNNTSTNALLYEWNFGDGDFSTDANPSHTYLSEDSFIVQLKASNDCGVDSSNELFIADLSKGIADFEVSIDACSQEISIKNTSKNTFSYFWNFGDDKSDSAIAPKHTYTSSGTYSIRLIVNRSTLCESELTKTITLSEEQGAIAIPNVFSPNGDGNNDIFEVLGVKDCAPYSLSIFNRWGELIFKSNDKKIGWDGFYKGKPQPAGVYVYMLNAIGKKYKGSITLIR
jgi:gliding motility-associated-like protein